MPDVHGSRSVASFRDPSGFVFQQDGILYRQVNRSYREDYDLLVGSGLYRSLVDDGWLVAHEEEGDGTAAESEEVYKVLRPERIPFISYPYEWCFGQLKDAALLTLAIQRRAVEHGMTLKGCNAYNVPFRDGGGIFIVTLSFGGSRGGAPWGAHRQSCPPFPP